MEENVEHENDCKRNNERSPSPAIKSTAVVKYTAFQSPVSYSRLQCNTDLNLPPANWGAAIDSYGLKQILTTGSELSSFRMAHMFPDCVADVDVIAGAEVIKRLLKLPYQPNGTVSMMVHRVENTLLLDDFHVYDYLMKSEWSWLKDFFYENILKTMSEQERGAGGSALLTAHFLSRSAPRPPARCPAPLPTPPRGPFLPEPETKSEGPPDVHLYNRNVLWTFEDIHMLIGSDLPIFGDKDRPCVSLRLRDANEPINVLTGIDYWLDNLMCNVPEVLMCYHLDGIVQKYEPMKTEDLPNMEDSKFSPKVIRNVAQNILSFLKSNATKAGHTYWLFKGPHDDVVKLYDLTSLCPDGLDNPFTTPVAMLLYRVARNMRLTNRTRHVKQLLEHVVELLKVERYPQIVASSHYMLADLYVPATTNPACPDFKEESSDSDPEDLDYPIPTEFNEPSERDSDIKDSSQPAGESEKQEWDGSKDLAVQIRGLALSNIGDRVRHNNEKSKSSGEAWWSRDPPARCGRALKHALKGLQALRSIISTKDNEEERERLKQRIISEELNPKMANPYEPIKMDYEPLQKKQDPKEHVSRSRRRKNRKSQSERTALAETDPSIDKNAIQIRKENNTFPSLHEPNRDDNFAWKLHLKTLIYEKICLAYATLAEYSYSHEQYGFALKYIDMATKCQKLLSNMIIKSKVVDSSCLIGRVGDTYFQLSKNWHRLEQFKKQFDTYHDIDLSLRQEIESDMLEEKDGVGNDEFDLDISMPQDQTTSMVWSCSHYKCALKQQTDEQQNKTSELQRRLASVTNELHVTYMQQAQQTYLQYINEPDPKSDNARQLLTKFNSLSQLSEQCLDESTNIFEQVNDVANLALLFCNKGRFLRFKAHCSFDQNGFTFEKRSLYNQAEELYHLALKLLATSNKDCANVTSVKELVQWELSCHVYTKAVHMQDSPTYRANEVSEVAEAFKHALKYCILSGGGRLYLYQFRAAMIYHRLGSLYHAQYRLTPEDGPKRRTLLNLSRNNYALSSNLLATLEDAAMFLTVQLEHVAVMETHAHVSPNLKLKSLQTAVQLLRQCHSIIKLITQKDPEEQDNRPADENDEKLIKNEQSLLALYENRLHHILKSIIQYCRSKPNKDYEKMTDVYKRLYCASLKIKKDDDVRIYAASICDVLEAMDEISQGLE